MKEQILRELILRNKPKAFKQTDIIPIVNYGWNNSFARVGSNRKAIIERGWNPCNYALLKSKDLLRTQPKDKTPSKSNDKSTEETPLNVTTPSNDSSGSGLITITINPNHGTAAVVIDVLREAKENEHVKQRMQQRQEENEKIKTNMEISKKLTSGVAFSKGIVGMHSDKLHDNLCNHKKQKMKKEKATAKKSKLALKRKIDSITKIREKSEDKYTNNDFCRLLSYKRQKNDPPLKDANNDRDVLLQWWNERKDRPSPTCSPCNSDDEDEESVDAEPIIHMI
jgi:hypothetical protein